MFFLVRVVGATWALMLRRAGRPKIDGSQRSPGKQCDEDADSGRRLVYVTPSHQWPLGVVMVLPRRLALLAWAERNNAAIIEDATAPDPRYQWSSCLRGVVLE